MRPPLLRISVIAALVVLLVAGLRDAAAPRAHAHLAPMAWVVNLAQRPGPSGPLPSKPLDGQKRPPCGDWEEAVNGGCWLKLATPKGHENTLCPAGYVSHNNACYAPVLKMPDMPVSFIP